LGPFFSTPPLVAGTRLVLPHIVIGGGYATKITLVNQTAATNTVSIQYFTQTGLQSNPFNLATSATLGPNGATRIATPDTAAQRTIAANSQFLSDLGSMPEFHAVLPNANFVGSLNITSDQPVAGIALEDDLGPFSAVPVITGHP